MGLEYIESSELDPDGITDETVLRAAISEHCLTLYPMGDPDGPDEICDDRCRAYDVCGGRWTAGENHDYTTLLRIGQIIRNELEELGW